MKTIFFAIVLAGFLFGVSPLNAQQIDLGWNSEWLNGRIALIYGPEMGQIIIPLPKLAVQYVPFKGISPYVGVNITAGNIFVVGNGSGSVYAGMQFYLLFAEVSLTAYDASYSTSRIFKQTQLNPKFGINFPGGQYFAFGPSFIISQESNMDPAVRAYPMIIPFFRTGDIYWNLEFGLNSTVPNWINSK